MSEGGRKDDQGKLPMGLLSTIWLKGVAEVLRFGATKYAAHNWRGGIAHSRLIDAALRHITAYNSGEDMDSESGLSHLYHASCCLMFLSELAVTHPDLDDRYKPVKSKDGAASVGIESHGYNIIWPDGLPGCQVPDCRSCPPYDSSKLSPWINRPDFLAPGDSKP